MKESSKNILFDDEVIYTAQNEHLVNNGACNCDCDCTSDDCLADCDCGNND